MLFLISCTNENEIFENENQYQKIANLIDTEDQKLAYSSLEAGEKLSFWKQKFDKIRNTTNLTNEQADFIDDIENSLTKTTFNENSNEFTVFKDYYTKVFDAKSKKLFNDEQCFLYFYSFELKEDLTSEKINYRILEQGLNSTESNNSTARIRECNCNTGGCKRLTGLSVWGLEWENGECRGITCWDDNWGCGFMGFYGCASLCTY